MNKIENKLVEDLTDEEFEALRMRHDAARAKWEGPEDKPFDVRAHLAFLARRD